MTRPTQSFAWRWAKRVPWPQSVLDQKQPHEAAAGIAMSSEAQAWPSEKVNQAAVHSATSGKVVIASSAMLRA